MAEPEPYADTVRRYRKRPVVIEAALLTADNVAQVAIWCHARTAHLSHLNISTLEGTMRADLGDYVIRGIKGEFYPCKPDIFEASYELHIDGSEGVITRDEGRKRRIAQIDGSEGVVDP